MRATVVLRRTLLGIWLCLLAMVVVVVIVGHGLPLLGEQPVIVKGPSMSPTIPLGSLLVEQTVRPAELAVGDVVTFVQPNGAVVTHRITRIAIVDGELAIETKGDANAAADSALHPADRVTGRVVTVVPYAGFLFAFLTIPSGVLSIASILGSLLLSVWLLEDVSRESATRASRPELQPTLSDVLPA